MIAHVSVSMSAHHQPISTVFNSIFVYFNSRKIGWLGDSIELLFTYIFGLVYASLSCLRVSVCLHAKSRSDWTEWMEKERFKWNCEQRRLLYYVRFALELLCYMCAKSELWKHTLALAASVCECLELMVHGNFRTRQWATQLQFACVIWFLWTFSLNRNTHTHTSAAAAAAETCVVPE